MVFFYLQSPLIVDSVSADRDTCAGPDGEQIVSNVSHLPEPYRTEAIEWARGVIRQKVVEISDLAYAWDVLEIYGDATEQAEARRFLAADKPAHNCGMLAEMNSSNPQSWFLPIVIVGGVLFLLACLIGWGFEAFWTVYNAAILGGL